MRLDDLRLDKQNDQSDKKTGPNHYMLSQTCCSESQRPFQLTIRYVPPIQEVPGEATHVLQRQIYEQMFSDFPFSNFQSQIT